MDKDDDLHATSSSSLKVSEVEMVESGPPSFDVDPISALFLLADDFSKTWKKDADKLKKAPSKNQELCYESMENVLLGLEGLFFVAQAIKETYNCVSAGKISLNLLRTLKRANNCLEEIIERSFNHYKTFIETSFLQICDDVPQVLRDYPGFREASAEVFSRFTQDHGKGDFLFDEPRVKLSASVREALKNMLTVISQCASSLPDDHPDQDAIREIFKQVKSKASLSWKVQFGLVATRIAKLAAVSAAVIVPVAFIIVRAL